MTLDREVVVGSDVVNDTPFRALSQRWHVYGIKVYKKDGEKTNFSNSGALSFGHYVVNDSPIRVLS